MLSTETSDLASQQLGCHTVVVCLAASCHKVVYLTMRWYVDHVVKVNRFQAIGLDLVL